MGRFNANGLYYITCSVSSLWEERTDHKPGGIMHVDT